MVVANYFLLLLLIGGGAVYAQVTCADVCQDELCCGPGPYWECCGSPCCGNYCCIQGWECVSNVTNAFCCIPGGKICGDVCYTDPCTCNNNNIQCPTKTFGCNDNGICDACIEGCTCESCTCYYDSTNGHWAGLTCDRCANWYTSPSTGCNTATPNQWNFAQNITDPQITYPGIAISGKTMIVNPSQVYQLSKDGNDWVYFQTLALQDTSLTFSGTGAIDGDTIFQLAYDSSYCYGVFFEAMSNGTWKQMQTLRLSIPTPCAESDSYSQVSAAIRKGVAAVMYTIQNSGVSNLAILVNDGGKWTQSAAFPLTSYFYFGSPMVAVGNGIVGVQLMTANYTSSMIYFYGIENGAWTRISSMSFDNPVMNLIFRDNVLYLGVANWEAENLPFAQVFQTNDNGYNWKQTAELIANYPVGDIWVYQTMAVSEDGNTVFLAGNPESTLGVNIWLFEYLGGSWILTGGFFETNSYATSSDSTGSNFALAGQIFSNDEQFVSYLIQSPFP